MTYSTESPCPFEVYICFERITLLAPTPTECLQQQLWIYETSWWIINDVQVTFIFSCGVAVMSRIGDGCALVLLENHSLRSSLMIWGSS
uniref:Uncharacterized protein n=1 Tax=Trichobilharzia regenti TaxID=157069 RepID=A0AA85IRR0_TRIRE|nr:unnamed protein product [Trichobilharzia regenti]